MIEIIKKEKVMTISLFLAVISSFFVRPDRKYAGYIDWRVLALLFCLMVVVKGFKEIGLFDLLIEKLGSHVKNLKLMVLTLVMFCFFGSMLITNDVALITFVPFALLALEHAGQKKYQIITVVLQTLAANLGSMFTPIGNPQNLYLFSVSGMSMGSFFGTMWKVTLISLVLLITAVLIMIPSMRVEMKSQKETTPKEESEKTDRKKTKAREIENGEIETKRIEYGVVYGILFIVNLLVVFHVLHWGIALAITIAGICLVRQTMLFQKVDYALLLTFVGFFIFIGNIGRIPTVSNLVENLLVGRELWMSALFSQFMSNVPAAILLSGFTDNYKALLLGTNIGGLGTLIASMASLISYKLYAEERDSNKGKYLTVFTLWNVVGLAILLVTAYFLY